MIPNPFPFRHVWTLSLCLAVLTACAETPTTPGALFPESCAEPGPRHAGLIDAPQTWTGRDGPHHLDSTVVVEAHVTLEAGTLVCGGPNGGIRVGEGGGLIARGTEERPVRFTATDPAAPWHGIFAGEQVRVSDVTIDLEWVVVEDAHLGVASAYTGRIVDAVVRRISGVGLAAGRYRSFEVTRVLVDSAEIGVAGDLAVLTDVVVRNSASHGLTPGRYGRIHLHDVRIEGSGAFGIYAASTGVELGEIDGLTVRGSVEGAFLGSAGSAARLSDAPAGTVTFEDNGVPGLQVIHGVLGEPATVRPGMPWSVREPVALHSTLRVAPGGILTIAGASFAGGGRIEAVGTAEDPAIIRAPWFGAVVLGGTPSEPSVLEHVVMDSVGVRTGAAHPVTIRNTRLGGRSTLGAPGSSIEASRIVGARLPRTDDAVLKLYGGTRLRDVEIASAHGAAGAAIAVAGPGVTIEGCRVVGAPGAAIQIAPESSAETRISGCTLADNAGPGVRNLATGPVDARRNWWGSAAGPEGDGGDGIEGAVVFEPFLTEPPPAGPVPARRR